MDFPILIKSKNYKLSLYIRKIPGKNQNNEIYVLNAKNRNILLETKNILFMHENVPFQCH